MLYDMIFKRKSFHIFKGIGQLAAAELQGIREHYDTLVPLIPDIRTAMRIVPAGETSCKRGQEYCILLYSEQKDGCLQNIGYLGQQLDLYLASRDIGSLWFGIGKVDEPQYDGLDFIIMFAIAKMPTEKFRKNLFKAKRKPLEEIWQGEIIAGVSDIARFSPSACNTQPWIVRREGELLTVSRYKKPGKRGIMPKDKVVYYNQIDMGIYLLMLEICLKHEGIVFERTLFLDDGDCDRELTKTAEYIIRTH
jgi:hypothetical protein